MVTKIGDTYPPGFPNINVEVKGIDLKPVDHVYKGGFFKNRNKLSWRSPIICESLMQVYKIEKLMSAIDVGCGIGDYVDWLNKFAGVICWGIEGSEAAREFFVSPRVVVRDIRIPFDNRHFPGFGTYDLAFSLEVAEHIEPAFAHIYLDNLCTLSDNILMTAAHPGQGGHGHVNCQEKGWWEAEMKNRGFLREHDKERAWVELLRPWHHRKEVAVYAKNVICFKKVMI